MLYWHSSQMRFSVSSEHSKAGYHPPPPTPYLFAKSNDAGVFGTFSMAVASSDGDGTFSRNSSTRLADFTDPTSNTIVVGERMTRTREVLDFNLQPVTYTDMTLWAGVVAGANYAMERVVGTSEYPPNAAERTFPGFNSPRPGSVSFLFGDGAVRPIHNSIDTSAYGAAMTRAGNESIRW